VVSAATAFEHFMRSAVRLDGGFTSGEAVAQGLKTAAAYEPTQLQEGMIAYGAIAALRDNRFVEGVEQAGRAEGRYELADRLVEDPFAVRRIDGAASAAGRVAAGLTSTSAPLLAAGAHVTAQAYSVQANAWSQRTAGDAGARLAEVKSLSSMRAEPSLADDDAMVAELGGLDARAADGASAGITAIEAKALALAAESVLGRAHGRDRDRLTPLFAETETTRCLRLAKLNLYQCTAVAGPEYEHMYCIGRHALTETGECVAAAARGGAISMAATGPRQAEDLAGHPRPTDNAVDARRSRRPNTD
jgi:hypothetical protein